MWNSSTPEGGLRLNYTGTCVGSTITMTPHCDSCSHSGECVGGATPFTVPLNQCTAINGSEHNVAPFPFPTWDVGGDMSNKHDPPGILYVSYEGVCSTSAPTGAPTGVPTSAPTGAPTGPTGAPTGVPTSAPTAVTEITIRTTLEVSSMLNSSAQEKAISLYKDTLESFYTTKMGSPVSFNVSLVAARRSVSYNIAGSTTVPVSEASRLSDVPTAPLQSQLKDHLNAAHITEQLTVSLPHASSSGGSPAPSSKGSSSGSNLSTADIVGIAVGCVGAAILMALVVLYFVRPRYTRGNDDALKQNLVGPEDGINTDYAQFANTDETDLQRHSSRHSLSNNLL